MDTSKLKRFAQSARRQLMEQVTAKLKQVLVPDSPAQRECPQAIDKLKEQIKAQGQAQVIEQVAYTWFNRFCALRFMDVNGYNRIGVVSPAAGQFQPEILAEAKMGYVDEDRVPERTRTQIFALLDGSAPSPEPQAEAYRLLVVAVCNDYHQIMPYLFQRIDDYTELLMPDDLLSGNSILAYTREAMTPQVCGVVGGQDPGASEEGIHPPLAASHAAAGGVEVIGWLYQFYISEKKDEVFAALKKNQKITPEHIPAATQLFTPHWIVRYLVENSLGRLWLLNYPNSRLAERMDYYIRPEEPETDFLRISSPEEIKVCDPACGSGHMLTYAFDLLYAIYDEQGYQATEIPAKILTHNLYGIEIDERAGELAAFALTMKARAKQRRFFRNPIQPHICVLESIKFAEGELADYMDFIGRDLFTAPLLETLHQFQEANNFGSLIRPVMTDVAYVLRLLKQKNVEGQLFLYQIHPRVLKALQQADYLSPKYHVVIANPPYMGGKGMNGRLSAWVKQEFPSSKSDLFAVSVERIMELVKPKGLMGFMTPFVWMFLSSYEKLRLKVLNENTLTSLIRPEYHAFFDSAYVPLCAFTLSRSIDQNYKGAFIDLQKFYGVDLQPVKALEAIANPSCGWFYRSSAADFKKIPGSPIAYWLTHNLIKVFNKSSLLSSIASPRAGLATGDNTKYQRRWHEVELANIAFNCYSNSDSKSRLEKWYPCNSGGNYRKWFGNNEVIVNWQFDGEEIRNFKDKNEKLKSRPQNTSFFFLRGVTWTKLSSSLFAARLREEGFIFDDTGRSAFPATNEHIYPILRLLCSKVSNEILKIYNPTLSFTSGDIGNLPVIESLFHCFNEINSKPFVEITRSDWDSYETSWDFTQFPLLEVESKQWTVGSEEKEIKPTSHSLLTTHYSLLSETYTKLRYHWASMTQEMQQLEEENNRIFIEAYGLQDEITPDVPLNEITLTCNPHYRYGGDKTEAELEALLLADTMREFISYAVGCMFGRYSLDKPGLILANQGDTIEHYRQLVPNSTFPADDDNVIPILDSEWFPDDISERFRQFLRVTFGEDHYNDNLRFLESAIGKDIRKYFLKDFYTDHLKRYKKRPIYWLFSSPKGSFNALIYMHRYRPDTVSIVLNDYLREFRTKLTAHKSHLEQVSISESASASERTKALKTIENLNKTIVELTDYERDVIYPLAIEKVEIDLDDGVKVNYGKFGNALKKIPGLAAKEG